MPIAPFQVGPYCCTPLAEVLPARMHVGGAMISRQLESETREARLVFDEEDFATAEEAVAYAAARADFLLRFEAEKVLSF